MRKGRGLMWRFRSRADGCVTAWSQDAEGDVPVRIYPNEYAAQTADERAAAVVAGEETCIGDDAASAWRSAARWGAHPCICTTRRARSCSSTTRRSRRSGPRGRRTRARMASSYVRYRVVDR